MAVPSNKNEDKRIVFQDGKQRELLLMVKQVCGCSWSTLASRLKISYRSLFDWRREKYTVSETALDVLCKLSNAKKPENIEARPRYWMVKNASRLGGLATYKKYGVIGDPGVRKVRWLQWWEKTGKYNHQKYFMAREIKYPEKSPRLAEFVGIMLGDGGLTNRQLTITLNSIADREYCPYVEKLVLDLFGIKPSIYLRKDEATLRIVVSSVRLVGFCKQLGLRVGNKLKQGLDVPEWVKKNVNYMEVCVRGLMDTDGCLFLEKHKIKEKLYSYPRLSLVSASPRLRSTIKETLDALGYRARIRNNRSVQLEDYLDIKTYFDKIGTRHPKNKEKFNSIFGGFG